MNLRQTNEERCLKYHLCRWLGVNYKWAMRMRDWRWNKIARRFGYSSFKSMKGAVESNAETTQKVPKFSGDDSLETL